MKADEWHRILVDYFRGHPEDLADLRTGQVVTLTELEILRDNPKTSGMFPMGPAALEGATLAFEDLVGPNRNTEGAIVLAADRPATTPISTLASRHVGRLVSVTGLVKSYGDKRPNYQVAVFQCRRCGAITILRQEGLRKLEEPLDCDKDLGGCGRAAGSTKFRRLNVGDLETMDPTNLPNVEELIRAAMVDERWMEIQEPPQGVEASARPAQKLVRMLGSRLCETKVLPGDLVTVDGILLPDDEENKKLAPPTYVDAHNLVVHTQVEVEMTEAQEQQIRQVAESPDPLGTHIVPSIAPRIKGHDDVKKGLACQLFCGTERTTGERDTIHVILLGDPATAKTEMMRAVCKLTPRGIFTTSKGSTQVGLTAAAVQEREFGEGRWVLKAGSIVLADRGICGIDEVGELEREDYKAIEEAMSQGTVSVAKAGITTTLNARTAILGAGNPKGGRHWDEHDTIENQVNIPPSTMSRFDLCYIIRDDHALDDDAVTHINRYHGLGDPVADPPLTPEMLRGYVTLARQTEPRLTEEAASIFRDAFRKIRAIPETQFTLRSYEGYLRIGKALARMRLSDVITADDAQEAVNIHHAGWSAIIDDLTVVDGVKADTRSKGLAWNIKKRLEAGPSTAMELSEFAKTLGFETSPKEVNVILTKEGDRGEVAYKIVNGTKEWSLVE